jgi:hypothetical protein
MKTTNKHHLNRYFIFLLPVLRATARPLSPVICLRKRWKLRWNYLEWPKWNGNIKRHYKGKSLEWTISQFTVHMLSCVRLVDDGCGAIGGMRIGRRNRSTRRKPAPVPLCPPQIPHDLTWARTRAAVVGNRRLIAWAMARPQHKYKWWKWMNWQLWK